MRRMAMTVALAALLAGCSATAQEPSDGGVAKPAGLTAGGNSATHNTSRPQAVAASKTPAGSASGSVSAVFVPPTTAAQIPGKIDNGYLFLGAGGGGVADIFGFFGSSSAAAGELATTSDAGARWTAGARFGGVHDFDGAQFVSPARGWAWTSSPGLYFTTDGAHSWQPASAHFYVQTTAAVADTMWFAGAPCLTRSKSCDTKLYVADHVGQAPTLLAHQPLSEAETITSLAAPSPDRVFALISTAVGGKTTARLERSTNGGRTWSRTALPTMCATSPSSPSLVAGPAGGLVLTCAAAGLNMNPSGPVSIFSTDNDAASWHELSQIRTHGEPSCCVTTVVAPAPDVLWATAGPETGSMAVFRSSDSGRIWTDVLDAATTQTMNPPTIISFTATGAEDAWALLKTFKGDGAVFWIVRTTNGGQTWRSSTPGFTA